MTQDKSFLVYSISSRDGRDLAAIKRSKSTVRLLRTGLAFQAHISVASDITAQQLETGILIANNAPLQQLAEMLSCTLYL